MVKLKTPIPFPLKWRSFQKLPTPRSSVRPLVAQLEQSELVLPEAAIAILGEICGRFLRTAQRGALGPLLFEQLTDARVRWGDYGTLSQADVLGAIVGLAVFLVDTPGDWLLLRIPEGQESTPDIFALQKGGAPWVVELKGVAPLSTEVEPEELLDTCGRIMKQRHLGLQQLSTPSVLRLTSQVPNVAASSGVPSLTSMLGGRALAITTFPDAALTERPDIRAPGVRGCPDQPCAGRCLRSEAPGFRTSMLSLLWKDANQPAPRNSILVRALSIAHALDLATWSDARDHADQALEQMTALSSSATQELGAEFTDQLFDRMLASSAVTASPAVHGRVASELRPSSSRIVQSPRRTRRRMSLEQALANRMIHDTDFDVGEESFSGRVSTARIELSASPKLVDEAAEKGQAPMLKATSDILERVRSRLGGDLRPIEVELRPSAKDKLVAKATVGFGLFEGDELRGWATREGRIVLLPRS